MINALKILIHQGKQYIPDVTKVELKSPYRGRPAITSAYVNENELATLCPLNAILTKPVRIDLGKCNFCGECAMKFPDKISFTADYKLATNNRDALIIKEGDESTIKFDEKAIRKELPSLFGGSLKLRQVSAGGDNSTELELNAAGNVNFDMGRFGIEFVASPRHADGIVITGPITNNMSKALQICYDSTPAPKIIILCGVDAISGGIFADSPDIDRTFIENHKVDLYIPGSPPHPLTFINAILDLIKSRK